ncbi:hypothetical protein BH23PLA1_BH23PLA1_43210 [soil metagenome]
MLLDTSGLPCLLHKAEPFHDQARTTYQVGRDRFTHNYVLADFVALAQVRRIPRTVALTFLTDLLENPWRPGHFDNASQGPARTNL